MPKATKNLVSFQTGEVSPRLDARIDQANYASALRQCLNMIPYKQGPLTRRPGTQFIASGKLQNIPGFNFAICLRKFIFSPNTTFVLEFGHNYIRFYSNGQQVMITTAPTWNSGQAYAQGAFVEDPGSTPPNMVYYCTVAVTSATQPHADATHWVQQSIYEVPSPYNANAGLGNPIWNTDVWTVAPCQINDVVYFAHPDYPPYKLTRLADTNWTMQQVNFISPALLDQNVTNTMLTSTATTGSVTLTASAPAWVTGNYYEIGNSVEDSSIFGFPLIYNCLVANTAGAVFADDLAAGYWMYAPLFDPSHIGSTWQLAYLRPSAYVEYDGTAAGGFTAGTSSSIKCLGNWEVHSYGVWSADIAIQRSLDGGQSWDTVRSVTGRNDRNIDITGNAFSTGLYQIVVSNVSAPPTAGPTDPRIVFECVDAFLYGLVKITGYSDAYTVQGQVITELASTSSTEYWSEAAWSGFRGYPQAVTSFQQRTIYGSSGYEPQRIWGSVTNDLENFALGDQTLATDSFAFDLNAPTRGPINSLLAQNDLFVFFSGAEWIVNSGSTNNNGQSSGAAITPTNVNAVEQSSNGSAYGVLPYVIGDVAVFCQRQAIQMRQMIFSIYTQKYVASDITALSEHIFTPGIVQIDYQPQWRGQSILWCVTQQGLLVGMTYEREAGIFGWHKHRTGYYGPDFSNDAGFESVCVIDGKGAVDDEIWVVANRTVGVGQVHRYIERINPNNWETTFTEAPNPPAPVPVDAFYVDSGKTYTDPGSATISGMDHLNLRNVVGLADGVPFGPVPVASGSFTIPNLVNPPSVVQVGLSIQYAGQPMRLDSDARLGPMQGQNKQLDQRFFVRVLNSAGGNISNGTVSVPIPYRQTAAPLTPPGYFVDGPQDIQVPPALMPGVDADPQFIVTGNDALPLTVIALLPRVSLIERQD